MRPPLNHLRRYLERLYLPRWWRMSIIGLFWARLRLDDDPVVYLSTALVLERRAVLYVWRVGIVLAW